MGDVLLPILKDTKDPHYRYKMPKLCAKVEGSGNGIKTVITNMSAIAKALGRPAAYPTKYFGCELGAQVTMNADIYVVNGAHDPEKLLRLLYDFIRKFVLCSRCNNPETSLIVANKTIRQKCIACGHEAAIKDTLHKLTTYIINHPPDGSGGSKGSAATTNGGGKSKSKSKSKGTSAPTNGAGGAGGNSPTQNGDSGNDLNKNGQDDLDEFDEDDFTTDAYAERIRGLCDGVSTAKILTDKNETANLFCKLLKEKKEANQLQDPNVQKELVKEAEQLELKDKAVLVLSEILFTENVLEEIKLYRLLLLRFCSENMKAQKYLLGGFEKLIGLTYKDRLFNNACLILKQFYDNDIIDEEAIIEWSAKESKKYVSKDMSRKVREKVAPFIKWLKEAEAEDDDDDEEEEEGKKQNEQATTTAIKTNGQQAVVAQNTKQQQQQATRHDAEEDEDDDGIDLEFSHRVSGIQIIETVNKQIVAPKAVNADVEAIDSANVNVDDIDIDNI